jgi:archaellum biogenesis ATPase FlaH
MLKNQEDMQASVIRETVELAAKKGQIFFLPTKLEDLMSKDFPASSWLIDGLIPSAGVTILSGVPASYKTFVLLEMAVKVSAGEPLFDYFPTEQTNVLIVDEESGERRLQARLQTLGVTNTLPIYLWSKYNFKLEDKYVDQLVKFCQEHEVGLVIFDSLVRVHDKDENDAAAMSQVFQVLNKCTAQGITVIFAHHNRKVAPGKTRIDLSSAMRGSSDIYAALDSHIAITRDEKRLVFHQTKSRDSEELTPFEVEVKITDETLSFVYEGDLQLPASKSSKATPVIIDVLTKEPDLNQKQIHQHLQDLNVEIGLKTVSKLLKTLEDSGKLVRGEGERNSYRYRLNTELDGE